MRNLDPWASAVLVISPYVVAELDYLVASRLGVSAELAVLRELAGGAWDLATFGTEDLAQAHAVVEHYADQAIGLADASIVILAARYQTRTVVTLDLRHFGVVQPIDGGTFKILPLIRLLSLHKRAGGTFRSAQSV
jgi:predicted nucleic acid-binding protein